MPAIASFDYAVIRVVPRVERGECLNVGVILYCATRGYLGARIVVDENRVRSFAPLLELEDLEECLHSILLVCEGHPNAGEIGRLPQANRFHWLVAPRSTVIQMSPMHSGLCVDPEATLEHLLATMVQPP